MANIPKKIHGLPPADKALFKEIFETSLQGGLLKRLLLGPDFRPVEAHGKVFESSALTELKQTEYCRDILSKYEAFVAKYPLELYRTLVREYDPDDFD